MKTKHIILGITGLIPLSFWIAFVINTHRYIWQHIALTQNQGATLIGATVFTTVLWVALVTILLEMTD